MFPLKTFSFEKILSLITLGVLVLIVGYLWIWKLDEYYLAGDSAWHVTMSHELNWNILNHVAWDAHPPLYYFFIKAILFIVGPDYPILLRSASLFFGLSTLVVTYFLSKKISKSQWVSLAMVFVIATSPLFILLSQSIRNYTLLIFLTSLSYLLALPKKHNLYSLVGLCSLTFLLSLTHYASIVLLPTFFLLGFLMFSKPQQTLRNILLLMVFFFGNFFLSYIMYSQRVPRNLFIINLRNQGFSVSQVGILLKNLFGFYEAYLVTGMLVLGIGLLIRKKNNIHLLMFFGPIFSTLLLSTYKKYPFGPGRHCSFLIPAIVIPLIYAFTWLKERKWFAVFVIFILICQLFEKPNIYQIVPRRSLLMGELGPRFSQMIHLKEDLKKMKIEEPIFFEWYFGAAAFLEQTLKPNWAVFESSDKKLVNCGFEFHNQREFGFDICKCLKSHGPVKGYFLMPRSQPPVVVPPQIKGCVRSANKFEKVGEFNLTGVEVF